MSHSLSPRQRWLALYAVCTGVLMMVLDTTIVTVALPSIQADLGFSAPGLTWVLNAYMLAFGGFLLLGGRLGDLYGQRRLFLIGLALFTVASLACGVAGSQEVLIVARAAQGLGGAVVGAVSLSLIMLLFTDAGDRTRAMGIYGFIMAAGGSLGEVLGGVLTQGFGWHSIFLVNLPIGVAVYWAMLRLLPDDPGAAAGRKLDGGGALAVTLGLLVAVYAVVDGNRAGWLSAQTLGLGALAAALLVAFIVIEMNVREPLMPLRLFRLRNLTVSNVMGMLWAAGMFGWFVITALYLQNVLGYNPLQVGLAFLPADVIMAVFSAGLSAKLVMRYGIRTPAWIGLAIGAAGLALIAPAPVGGRFVTDVLPGMLLLGIGGGIAFNPILMAAMNDTEPGESGLASGIVNTSFMMGGALGLAVLASIAEARTLGLAAEGLAPAGALAGGYRLALVVAALVTAAGAVVGAIWLRPRTSLSAVPAH